MFEVILYEPEIPPNTGNIMRLCANAGVRLHLIEPLGFNLEDRALRRAGLDYREYVNVQVYSKLEQCLINLRQPRLYGITTRGEVIYTKPHYQKGDALLFGPETRGLPINILQTIPPNQRLRIPMCPDNRSLNLANSVAIIIFEAWRQLDFLGAVQ